MAGIAIPAFWNDEVLFTTPFDIPSIEDQSVPDYGYGVLLSDSFIMDFANSDSAQFADCFNCHF